MGLWLRPRRSVFSRFIQEGRASFLSHSMVPWGERSRPLTTSQVTRFSQGHGAALRVEWSQAPASGQLQGTRSGAASQHPVLRRILALVECFVLTVLKFLIFLKWWKKISFCTESIKVWIYFCSPGAYIWREALPRGNQVSLLFWGGHTMQYAGSKFPNQGLNPRPLHWRCRVLTH